MAGSRIRGTAPEPPALGPVDTLYDEVRREHQHHAVIRAPTPAVACVLWRRDPTTAQSEPGSPGASTIEVYLARRSLAHPFLGGFWSFPGGRVEPGDADLTAACAREVREEVGLELPADASAYRAIARFLTPDFSPLRFDATYLMIEAPSGAAPDPSVSPELDEGVWIRPLDALAQFRAGQLLIPTPVLLTLGELAGTEFARNQASHTDRRLEERLAAAGQADAAARLWPLAGGIAIAPLRTPTLPPAAHTNAYVIGARELVVIDPGSPWPDERAALAEELARLVDGGARVRAVLLSHHHGDHTGGAADLAARLGAPIWAHRETARLLAGRVAVDRALEDGDLIELTGDPPRRLRAVFTPGHAPGHLCFHEEETGWTAVGDMVASLGTILIDPSEGDMRDYLESLDRLARLGSRVLLPAHGIPIADPAGKLAEYVRHRLWREERVAAALAARGRARAADLVPLAYADVVPALYRLAERSLVAHLVKLAGDGKARLEGEEWQVCPGD